MEQTAVTENKQTGRIPLFDNLKIVAMLFVVIMHFANNILYASHSVKALYIFVVTVNIPLFLFIAGLMHRGYKDVDAFRRRRFISFLLIFFALKIFIVIVQLITVGEAEFYVLYADSTPWFMLALALYEIVAYVIRGLNPAVIMIIALLLSLFSGMDSTVKSYLVLSRLIVFLPFFLAGYFLTPEKVAAVTRKWYFKLISAAILVGYVLLCWFNTDFIYAYRKLFGGNYPFSLIAEDLPNVSVLSRLFTTVISAAMCSAILCIVPNIRIKGITLMGQRTLQIFFWHRPILYVITYFEYYEVLKACLGGSAARMVYFVTAAVLTAVLALPVFRHPTDELSFSSKKHPGT